MPQYQQDAKVSGIIKRRSSNKERHTLQGFSLIVYASLKILASKTGMLLIRYFEIEDDGSPLFIPCRKL